MRFVHVLVGSADPRSVNGVNKVVHWLAETQTGMGHHSEVWAIKPDGAPATHERSYPMTVFRGTRSRFTLSPELKQAIDQLPPDTWVQLHSVFVPELTAVAHRLHKRDMLYGFTPHGGYLSIYFDPSVLMRTKKAIFSALWENWTLRHAAMIHVIGATEIDDLRSRAPHAKMVLIPNGYTPDMEILGMGPRQEAEPPAIMFCGRHVNKQKGLDLLLRGFGMYRKQGGTLRLVLISGGKDNAMLRALAEELGVADAVTWPGVLPVDELRRKLRGAAAFVHTSRFDVLPTGCLEAAALALPLFMSEETNFESYLLPRNAGWICSPNTPEVIAGTMWTIEQTPREERIAMGENARRMIQEELRWDRICETFERAVLECRREAGIALPEPVAVRG